MKKSVIIASVLAFLALFSFSFAGCSNGEDGLDGKDGANGVGLIWQGELDEAPSNPEYMWAYYNKNDGCSYVWNGSSWNLLKGGSTVYDVEILDLSKEEIEVRVITDGSVVSKAEKDTVYFKDDIMYTFIDNEYIKCLKDGYKCDFTLSEINADTKQVVLTNTTRNASATFDLSRRSLSFSNYDAFFQDNDDVFTTMTDNYPYLKTSSSANISGQDIELSWTDQNIHAGLYKDGDSYKLAIPNQFLLDIFQCGNYSLYNGRYIYRSSDLRASRDLLTDYYDTCLTPGTRSQSLADFTYNELCLNLDFNYGLKAIHGIESFPDFDSYFMAQGIDDDLKSTDAVTFTKALIDVVDFYFGDGHSGFSRNSCWAGASEISGTKTTKASLNYIAFLNEYGAARAKAVGGYYDKGISDDIPAFTLSADKKTAIVRFDAFTAADFESTQALAASRDLLFENNSQRLNAYVDETLERYLADEGKIDTLAVIAAANKLIQDYDNEHPEAKIENIVLDLSRNGGGRFTAAAYVISWMLGECTMDFTNPITGAKFSVSYVIDADLNGICGEAGDTVKDKNLFCLITPCSFSCGNLTPAVLKESGRATILGVTSGGGASSVHGTSCADGSQFQISSKYVMSTKKNGSNYDMDQGVTPHYYINRAENFYNTETLASLVNSINSGKFALSAN